MGFELNGTCSASKWLGPFKVVKVMTHGQGCIQARASAALLLAPPRLPGGEETHQKGWNDCRRAK
jgi:hypothetical protein